MKRTIFTALLLMLLAATVTGASSGAQSELAAKPSPPKFTSSSQLVVVPAVVVRDGKPVTGLKREQFKVYQDGKQQRISYFEEIKADSSPAKVLRHNDPVHDTFSNTQVDRSSPKRLVIIALDLINTTWEDSVFGRYQLIKFLSSNVDDSVLISLVAIQEHGVKVIHDFTTDPEVLVAVLKKVRHKGNESGLSGAGLSNSAAFNNEVKALTNFLQSGRFPGTADLEWSGAQGAWFTVRQTLDALNLIGQAYAGVPGRKSLIWATGGFPFSIDSSGGLGIPGGNLGVVSYYEHTWRVMNQANIAIYPVDVRGLTVDSLDASTEDIPFADEEGYHRITDTILQRSEDNLSRINTLHAFADMTGGRAFYNSNDIAGGFRKAATDSASYYLLSYYMGRTKQQKSRWHDLKVEVDLRGTEVRARSGFYSAEETPNTVKDEIAMALTSPLDFTALPVSVRWLNEPSTEPAKAASQQANGNSRSLNFEIFVPPNSIAIDESASNRLSLQLVTAARSGEGKTVHGEVQNIEGKMKKESIDRIRSHGWLYHGAISLPPGTFTVRFVVRDNVGQRTGSVIAPLKVK